MGFRVVFSKEALRQLKKLDKQTALLITGWVRKNLEGTDDPRAHGKPLTSNRAGQWRYRVGDYRQHRQHRHHRHNYTSYL